MKRRKKLLQVCAAAALPVLLLSGCVKLPEPVEQKLLEQSGVVQEEDYLRAAELQAAEPFDEKYYYQPPEPVQQTENHEKKALVSFGQNSNLELSFYRDEALTVPVAGDTDYFSPGDAIYAALKKNNNAKQELYDLHQYWVYEYDAEGVLVQTYTQDKNNQNLVFKLPEGCETHRFSVMPLGRYADVAVSLSAYLTDQDGNRELLESAGTWLLNGEPCRSDQILVSPVEPYVLKFDFDEENYFFISSQPACFTEDPAGEGAVEFWKAMATGKEETYSVELRSYLELSLETSEPATISLNDADPEKLKKNKTWTAEGLQFGDTIRIETEGTCTVTGGDYHYLTATRDPIEEGYRYTLRLEPPQKTNDQLPECLSVVKTFRFTLVPELEHCECVFELDGEPVSGPVEVREDQKLTLTCKIVDKNYCFEGGQDSLWGRMFPDQKKNEKISIGPELENQQIRADSYFTVVRKEAEP